MVVLHKKTCCTLHDDNDKLDLVVKFPTSPDAVIVYAHVQYKPPERLASWTSVAKMLKKLELQLACLEVLYYLVGHFDEKGNHIGSLCRL